MNRNTLLFVLLSVLVLLGWNFYEARTSQRGAPAAAAPAASGPAVAVAAPAPPSAAPFKPAASAARRVRVETAKLLAELSSQGAGFSSLQLKGVRNLKTGEHLELVPSQALAPRYGALELPGTDLDERTWDLRSAPGETEAGRPVVRFATRLAGTTLELTKTFRFEAEGSGLDVELQLRNAGRQPLDFKAPLSLLWGPDLGGDEPGMGHMPPAGVVQVPGRVQRERADKEQKTFSYGSPLWVALKNHYFAMAYFPAEGSAWTRAEIRTLGNGHLATALQAEGLRLKPGESLVLKARAWAGPQDYQSLKAMGKNFQSLIQFETYGWLEWLNPLCVALLHVMRWFHQLTGNWGLAIILLTLLVRAALFYPSLKSMVSMRRMQVKMAAMKPRLETLKQAYKDNPRKLNEETMKLYKEHGVNPLGGCLPMLLQIPIFFSLYGTLAAAFELRGAEFFWKWTDLTAGDPTYLFPLAMGASMFWQQKLAPSAANVSEEQQQMQKMMLWMMPLMFTGMSLMMHWPVGLLLYWTASNLAGIVQQLAVNRMVDREETKPA